MTYPTAWELEQSGLLAAEEEMYGTFSALGGPGSPPPASVFDWGALTYEKALEDRGYDVPTEAQGYSSFEFVPNTPLTGGGGGGIPAVPAPLLPLITGAGAIVLGGLGNVTKPKEELMALVPSGVQPGDAPGGGMIASDYNALAGAVSGGVQSTIVSIALSLIAKYGFNLVKGILISLGAGWILSKLTGAIGGGGSPPNVNIVKRWNTGNWDFSMDDRGVIWTQNKDGVWKHWKPKKPIVLVRGRTSLANAVKAQRYLDHLWRTVAKRTKALKLA